ncbi:MAG: TerC family protein [Fibrobacteres bacterium]|nr:TerC family protein [Fibrobacterota bacterium]
MTIIFWVAFVALIAALLALDLGVFHKKDSEPTTKSALRWTLVWICVGLIFGVFVYGAYTNHWLGIGLGIDGQATIDGKTALINYLTGYVIEYSLSMDNIFVMALIFGFFKIPSKYQHRVLFWGILGAIFMRAAMILAGTALVRAFDWTLYVFGAFLVFTAVKMLFKKEDNIDPEHSWIVKLVHRFYPVSNDTSSNRFFVMMPDGRKAVTRMFLALVFIENTDVVFAVDSIPAIFAVTTDPFLVFTSNIFAILGLRSLYFALSAMLNKFHMLKFSLVAILAFVGIKMLIVELIHIPAPVSLGFIVVSLGGGIAASLLRPVKE